MKVLKVLIKPFEVPQRNVKVKNYVNFVDYEMHVGERVNLEHNNFLVEVRFLLFQLIPISVKSILLNYS